MSIGNNIKLTIEDIHLSFGEIKAINGVSFDVKEGELLAIIGPNGAGKTCIFNCISGIYRPERGEIYYGGKKILGQPPHKIAKLGISRVFQHIELFTGLSTIENLMAARHIKMKHGVFAAAIHYGWTRREEVENRKVVEKIIDFLELESVRNRVVGTLPYGIRKRVDLGRALAVGPNVLLLDEPMAGMNLEEKEDMARFIIDIHEEQGTTIVMVEHDMEVVMDLAQRIIVLDFGNKIAEGKGMEIRFNPLVIKAYLGKG